MVVRFPSPPGRLDVLATLPLFGALDPSERARLGELFVEESYRKGDVICREGEEGGRLYADADTLAADVRIQPDLSGFTLTDYHRPQEVTELGAAAAEDAMPAIRRALAAKLSASARPAAANGGHVGVGGLRT